jgi:uncharacterized protein YegP (UPF0339 family)
VQGTLDNTIDERRGTSPASFDVFVKQAMGLRFPHLKPRSTMRKTLKLSLAVLIVASTGLIALSRPATAAAPEKKADATFEVYKDKAGEFRWRLRMKNTKVIATSGEGYSSKSACEHAIDSVKKNAPDAAVEEMSADAPAEAK